MSYGRGNTTVELHDSFALLVSDAVESAISQTALAERWGVSESIIRAWINGVHPRTDTLKNVNFDEAERLRLLRLLSGGFARIEPLQTVDAPMQTASARDVFGQTTALIGHACQVQRTWHESLADGIIDQAERARIEFENDELIRATRRTRTGFFARLRGMFSAAH